MAAVARRASALGADWREGVTQKEQSLLPAAQLLLPCSPLSSWAPNCSVMPLELLAFPQTCCLMWIAPFTAHSFSFFICKLDLTTQCSRSMVFKLLTHRCICGLPNIIWAFITFHHHHDIMLLIPSYLSKYTHKNGHLLHTQPSCRHPGDCSLQRPSAQLQRPSFPFKQK